jgi:hypothetical protein
VKVNSNNSEQTEYSVPNVGLKRGHMVGLMVACFLMYCQPMKAGEGAQALNTAMSKAASAASGFDIQSAVGHFQQCGPGQYHHCVIGALYIAQAAMMMQGSKDAKDTADQAALQMGGFPDMDLGSYNLNYGNRDYDPTNPSNANNSNSSEDTNHSGSDLDFGGSGTGDLHAKYKSAERLMNEKGWSIKEGNIVAPDGKSIPVSSATSPAALASLGMSGSEIEKINEALAEADKRKHDKINVIAMGSEGGAGGRGSASGGGKATKSGEGGFDHEKFLADLMRKKQRQPAGVVGMKKTFGSDPIGVSADNIFSMIQRRYDSKYKSNHFIRDNEAPKTKVDSPYHF